MARPTIYDDGVRKAVVEALAPVVVAWLGDGSEVEDVATDLEDAFYGVYDWDAYRLARALENAGWEPDEGLVNELGRAHMEAIKAHGDLVRKWVEAEGLKPTHAVGDRVKTKRGLEGEVTRVDTSLARYLVFSEKEGHVRSGPGTHGTYVDFEDLV